MAVFACDAGVSGTYDLVTINDELPLTFELFGTVTITSGSLTLSDSTFTTTLTSYDGADGDPETFFYASGTFTLDESNIIHFTSGPESEDDFPPEGTWDGDQISVSEDDWTLVFRR
jgi:hypothetical protein